MALKVWLPLIDGISNNGLDNSISVTATAVNEATSSPIKGCYTFTTGQNITINGIDFSKLKNASISVWVKQTTLKNTVFFTGPSTSHYVIASNTNGTSDIYQSNNVGGVKKVYVDGVEGTKLGEAGKWHHYVVAGINLSAWTGTVIKFNNYNSSYNFAGAVCDIRIYDHCLSPKEVRELSKALVQHLKLDTAYIKSIIPWPSNGLLWQAYNNHGTGFTATSSSTEPEGMRSGVGYRRYTFEIKTSNVASSVRSQYASHGLMTSSNYYIDAANGTRKSVFWTYCRPLTSGLTASSGPTNIEGWTQLPTEYVGDGWYRIGQYRTGNTKTTTSDRMFLGIKWLYASANSTCVMDVIDRGYYISGTTVIPEKFEEVAGSYVGAPVYDCSGYGNDGFLANRSQTSVGTVYTVSGSPRYGTAIDFKNGNHVVANRCGMIKDAITVAVWGYMNNWSSFAGRLASCTEGGGWNFEPGTNGIRFACYAGGYALAEDTLSKSSYTSGWHHFAGTFDGTKKKACFYRDGEYISSAATAASAITYHPSNSVIVGGEADSSGTVGYTNFFNNPLSDFRIYGRALSPEDIAELYHTSASIDNKGNFYCAELNELE